MEDIIYWLSQIKAVERELVGNELFVLSQLLQDEHPVLPGFVLSNNLWRQFLLLTDLESGMKNVAQDYRQLQAFSRRNRQVIQQITVPQQWQEQIFHSAQQLNSTELILQPCITSPYAKIEANSLWRSPTCNCHPEALIEALKSIWAEVFSAGSLVYLQKLGLSERTINLAILVRPLKDAVVSGTIAIDDELIKIDATWGLQQSLLQGDVEPDSYYLDRESEQVIFRHLGHKNYAYRLKHNNLDQASNDCLSAYLPSEGLATAYVLTPEEIVQLIEQAQDIIRKQPQIKYLTWTAIESLGKIQYYFLRLSDRLISSVNLPAEYSSESSLEPPLIAGIAVSFGVTTGELAVIPDLNTVLDAIPTEAILVTQEIKPQQIHLIKQVRGIITETGGRNSHAAIVARELNIPAVINAAGATKILRHGDRVLLDGDNGRIYPATVDRTHRRPISRKALISYPIATKLMVNLSQPTNITAAANLPVDGVGLLRSELMLADLLANRTLAQWQESFQQQFIEVITKHLRSFVTAFAPRPIFYRSLDLYGQNSTDSVFGDRGTYSYSTDPTLFDLELTALKTVIDEGHHNLNLILPFVRSVNEFEYCYRRIANLGLTASANFQVWMMAEVPSVIYLLPEYIRAGVGGIAIGTNDLTQLFLGVDREQNQFSDRGLNANHTAMRQAFEQLIQTAHEHNVECCICGQAPVEYPDLIDQLIQWGIDAISVEPATVAQAYQEIARAEKRLLLREITTKNN